MECGIERLNVSFVPCKCILREQVLQLCKRHLGLLHLMVESLGLVRVSKLAYILIRLIPLLSYEGCNQEIVGPTQRFAIVVRIIESVEIVHRYLLWWFGSALPHQLSTACITLKPHVA